MKLCLTLHRILNILSPQFYLPVRHNSLPVNLQLSSNVICVCNSRGRSALSDNKETINLLFYRLVNSSSCDELGDNCLLDPFLTGSLSSRSSSNCTLTSLSYRSPDLAFYFDFFYSLYSHNHKTNSFNKVGLVNFDSLDSTNDVCLDSVCRSIPAEVIIRQLKLDDTVTWTFIERPHLLLWRR